MSVYRQHNGVWRAEVWHRSKKVRTKSGFKRKADALRWEQCLKLELGYMDPTVLQNITLSEFIDRFRDLHLINVRSTTRTRYEVDIQQRILPLLGSKFLVEISRYDITLLRDSCRKSGLSDKSINNCTDLLSLILNKAVEWGFLSVACKVSRLKIPQKHEMWWDKKEYIKKFLSHIQGHQYELICRLALDLGLRSGEILGLSKQDVNFQQGIIEVHRQWVSKEKRYGATKGGRKRFIHFNLNSRVKVLLEEAVFSSSHREAIFVDSNNNLLDGRNISKSFQRMVKACGIPMIRFHDLRHTFASWYMLTGGEIWKLKAILGHQSVKTTERYAHLSNSQYVEGFDNFGAIAS